MKNAYLQVSHINKTFPGVKALQDVSLEANRGEILALVGINGAGKSTLMNVLSGVITVDSGEIRIDDKLAQIASPQDAAQHGIAIIHQESIAFQYMSVAENLNITQLNRFTTGGRINYKAMYAQTREDLNNVGCSIDPKAAISDITIGQRQMVEITRALNQNADIILFDEPTSSLTVHEKKILFDVIRDLKARNKLVIYISHFLDEIMEISDRVVVMRDGRVVVGLETARTSISEIIENMVGHKATETRAEFQIRPDHPVLKVSGLTTKDHVKGVDLQLCEGEILGLWGLLGSGRTEIIRAMLGLDKRTGGSIIYYDEKGDAHNIRGRQLMAHCGYTTESRHTDGLFLKLPVFQNFSMADIGNYKNKFGMMVPKAERNATQTYVEKLQIKVPGLSAASEQLSGGNQQKLIIARWLNKHHRFYIFDEPTRGVDVDAKAQIHQLIFDLARQGNAVIVISSEIEECMTLSSRIAVIRKGSVVAELPREEVTDSKLLLLCMGEEVGIND